MGANTRISWCDDTFNPWIGCEAVSPGCANCYARTLDHRWGKNRFGVGAKRELTSDSNWRKPLAWNREAKASGERRLVFTGSMCDVFDEAVPNEWRYRLFNLIDETPNLTWLLLTKRAQQMYEFSGRLNSPFMKRPIRHNLWLGVTAENQEQSIQRVLILKTIPAALRFVSVEPMLGPINTSISLRCPAGSSPFLKGIGWVICGGESGHGAREFRLRWARDLRDQCAEARVPFFMKQLGRNHDMIYEVGNTEGRDPQEWPADLRVQQFPAKEDLK